MFIVLSKLLNLFTCIQKPIRIYLGAKEKWDLNVHLQHLGVCLTTALLFILGHRASFSDIICKKLSPSNWCLRTVNLPGLLSGDLSVLSLHLPQVFSCFWTRHSKKWGKPGLRGSNLTAKLCNCKAVSQSSYYSLTNFRVVLLKARNIRHIGRIKVTNNSL